jgi:polyhydroxybutyrate depolymerase
MRRPAVRAAALAVALAGGVLASGPGCRGGGDAPPPGAVATTSTAPAGDVATGCRAGEIAGLRGVRREVTVGDEVRSYLLDMPRGPAGEPRPVLLVFHGFRAPPGRLRRWTGMGRIAQREGMIVVFPEGHDGVELLGTKGRGWDMEVGERRDVAFVVALLDALEREWCIDRRRVYAAGMSNGGFFANLLGCVLPDRFAAVASVAGAKPLPACPDPKPIPTLLIHGANDRVVDPVLARSARTWRAGINGCTGSRTEQHCTIAEGCRADVVYCEASQGHWWPRPATRRILAFIRAHALP